MLEADTLCNRIAIMAHGQLKTIGTQQWLKDTYGSGFLLQLNLTHSDAQTQDRALEFVRTKLHPGAVIQTRQAKTLHIALPRRHMTENDTHHPPQQQGEENRPHHANVSLADIFRVLYSAERFEYGNINQFLFSQSSLEDVFVAMGE